MTHVEKSLFLRKVFKSFVRDKGARNTRLLEIIKSKEYEKECIKIMIKKQEAV